MRFNRFVWELYSQSDRGKKAIERFAHLTDDFIEPWCRSIDLGDLKSELGLEIESVNVPKLVHDAVFNRRFADIETATSYYRDVLVSEGIPYNIIDKNGEEGVLCFFEKGDEEWYNYITAISLGLYWAYPDFFLPYDFCCKFNQLEEIHSEFNIPLPPIPSKYKKEARGLYYLSINQAWQEFRHLHGLHSAEMCAFLYDFAPQSTISLKADDLPSPSKIWLITGGSGDIETVDKATPDTISRWAGNAAIRRGDILLLYLVSPRKAISSIWRACTDGFVDPFFHYHSTVWICDPIKTTQVSFADLKNHPLLSEKPAVKANFFGPSSKASFTVEEYEVILEIMESKGQDLATLPRIPLNEQLPPQVELQNERDVEVQLIEPFLKRLGYKDTEWIRQMPVKMGRGERNYPDYAFGTKTKRVEECAKMILESKYQLSAQREFVDAFYQVKSYALRLQSKVMAMAAKEGIWVFPLEKGTFDIKKAIHKSWADLAHPDKFHEVLIRIGRDNVLG